MNRIDDMRVDQRAGQEKSIVALGAAMIAALLGSGCVAPTGAVQPSVRSAAIRYVEPADVRPLQLQGEVFLVHVGDDVEYDMHRIPGAAQRRVADLSSLVQLPEGRQVVLYEPGFGALDSDDAQPVLARLAGRVAVLRGGLAAWEQKGFPVEGRGVDPARQACRPVTAAALQRALRDRDDFTVVDVRPKQDFEMAHLPRAVSAPPEELRKLLKTLSKAHWVIVYDQQGSDGVVAGEQFVGAGFRYCGYLAGGYAAWAGSGATAGTAVPQKK